MDDSQIEKKRTPRKALLQAMYGLVEGREGFTITPMQYFALGSEIGLDRDVTGQTVHFLVSEGLLVYKPASEAVALTHRGVARVESQADETCAATPGTTNVQTVSIEEGVPLKLVTLEGECFELTLARKTGYPDRDGELFHFLIDDLIANRGRVLVSVFASGTLRVLVPNCNAQIDSVILNKMRGAFDSGELTFVGTHDSSEYRELVLQPEDFKPQKATADEIQELIKHEAYWLGFRYSPNPRYLVSFDSQTDLDYLGVSPNDVRRYVMLLEHRGLLERVFEGGKADPQADRSLRINVENVYRRTQYLCSNGNRGSKTECS